LFLVNGYYKDEDGEELSEPCHAVVQVPKSGLYADALGVRSAEEIVSSCMFSRDIAVDRVVIEPANVQDVAEAFTIEDVNLVEFRKAKDWVRQNMDKFSQIQAKEK